MFLATIFSLTSMSLASEAGKAQVIFEVGWYDVGKTALEGQPGVVKVEKGWRMGSEINTVVFDPGKINIETMEKTLKQTGTYIDTVPDWISLGFEEWGRLKIDRSEYLKKGG